jgi:hypothetical protein
MKFYNICQVLVSAVLLSSFATAFGSENKSSNLPITKVEESPRDLCDAEKIANKGCCGWDLQTRECNAVCDETGCNPK